MGPLDDELAALRREMRAVDKALLEQVARRLRTAQKIGALKRRKGLPLRNYDVEAEVIREARRLCRRFHIDQHVGEEVMRVLIEAAVQAQEQPPAGPRGQARTPARGPARGVRRR